MIPPIFKPGDVFQRFQMPSAAGVVGKYVRIASVSGDLVQLEWVNVDAEDITAGVLEFARLPVGTSGSTVAVGNHTHGNITNDGKIGSTANLPLITTDSGAIIVGAFGTSANTFCEGNDSRLLSEHVVLSGVDTVDRISLDASNGVIDWGLALTGNSRGSLTWDTNKAIVESPIRLDLEAPTIALVSVTAVCSGELIWLPNSSTTLSVNGQICIDRLSNTQVRLKMRGDDETNRLAILTLS